MNTKALRQKILDLAIHGKLVPQDPNDEPASVLLERIRDEKERLIKEGKIKRPKKTKTTSDKPHYENVLPERWKWCKLEDIAFIGTGATPMTKCSDYYYKGEIAWINSSSTNAPYIDKASNFITKKAISETNCVIYPKGTLILAMYGEGKTRGQISELLIEAATNQACAAICPFYKETKEYIKIFFESNYWHLRTLAEGGTQPNLNLGKISSYDIPFPPIEEQKRIVEEAKHWITIIDVIEQRKSDLQETIKQVKSKILDLAIHGQLVPQDPMDEPACELLKRINPKAEITCDNGHYQKLPEGWCRIPLLSLCNCYQPQTIPISQLDENGEYPVYGANGIIGRYNQYNHKEEEILLTCRGATCGEVNKSQPYSWVNGNAMIVHPLYDIDNHFLYYLSHTFKNHQGLISGTAQPQITRANLGKILICLPPLDEQHRIVAKIEEIFAQLDAIETSL